MEANRQPPTRESRTIRFILEGAAVLLLAALVAILIALHITRPPIQYNQQVAGLEETVQAIGTLLGRLVDPAARADIADEGLPRLVAAYQQGGQRAAERLVLSGRKVGDLALSMRASFTEDDLLPPD